MKVYQVYRNPLAAMSDCDEKSITAYLEQRLEEGAALVAVVDYAGTPYWVFSAGAPKAKPVGK